MARTKVKNPNYKSQNEDSKSMTSQVSGSQAPSQRGASAKGSRKGAKTRTGVQSERSASKSRPQKEDLNMSQASESKNPPNLEMVRSMSASQQNISERIDQQKQIMRINAPGQIPPQIMPRQIDSRVVAAASAGAQSGPGQQYQRMPTNLPPQITAADVTRAQSSMPPEAELLEADIAGERVKASMKTIDYLKRFEGFLNKGPGEKLAFLNEKFFRKIPRDTGVFKTNKGKEVKCPVCMKNISSPQVLETHFKKNHKELVQLGMEYSNGEFKVSNKIANLVAIFCFTHATATTSIVKIAKDKLNGKAAKFFEMGKEDSNDEE